MIIFFIVSGFSFLSQAVYLPGVNTSGRSLHPGLIPVSPLLPGLGQGVSPDSSVPNNRDCSFSGGGTGTRYIVWWRPLICPALCPAPHFHTLSHFVFLFLSAKWTERHREADLGPEIKLMLQSGEQRQVLVWGLPGCDCSQVLDLSEPVSRPGKWECYPVAGWLKD